MDVKVMQAVDGPWELPEGWCWSRPDGVAAINPSTLFDSLDGNSEITFVPMAAGRSTYA